MNLPNLLSISRLFVTIFFILAIYHGRFKLALVLFALQGISDMLDGFLARVMGAKTSLGAFLDPLADKVMLVSSYAVLFILGIVPLWVLSVVLLRDLVVSSGFLYLYKTSCKLEVSPSLLGKITTFCQIGTIVYILWSEVRMYQDQFFYATAILTILSGGQYVFRGFRILFSKNPAAMP
jgi:cardiolipin synthase